MPKDFCDCLVNKDWSCVKKDINTYLNTVDKNAPEDSISAGFKQWLLKNTCITEVTIMPGMVETNPPVKQFQLTITTSGGIVEKTLGIQISKKVLQAHIY